MGEDVHEYRRYWGIPDNNPTIRRVRISARSFRVAEIIAWRKRRASAVQRYRDLYLGGSV